MAQVEQAVTDTMDGFEILQQGDKNVKNKIEKFWWLIPTFKRVIGEKLVGGFFALFCPEYFEDCYYIIKSFY